MSHIFKLFAGVVVVLVTFHATHASASQSGSHLSTPFRNLDEVARLLNIDAYSDYKPRSTSVKIAILDNGFRYVAKEIGKTLPENTVYHPGSIPVDPATEESHGLFMAQIVSGLLARTAHGSLPYQMHLYSAFGYTNFKEAIDAAVADHVDIILYSQVWEYGGNGDGHGFINAAVSKAVASGIIWINASGNFNDGMFRSSIERAPDDWVKLPAPNNSVRVRCLHHPRNSEDAADKGKKAEASTDECQLRVVLSWNDFHDDVNEGTDKDLDLVLTDDTMNVIETSALVQVKSNPDDMPGRSLYPREIIEAKVAPGLYNVRVKMRSQNFAKAHDQLRITVSGDLVKLC